MAPPQAIPAGTANRTFASPTSTTRMIAYTVLVRLARLSIAGSSWTRQRRRPTRTTPTANAMPVIGTSPSGTIVTTPATAPVTASEALSAAANWVASSGIPAGTISQVTYLRNALMPAISSECAGEKRLASATRRAAPPPSPPRPYGRSPPDHPRPC